MDVYLIRHTSLAILSGICYGQSDVEPADSFSDEVQTLRSNLPKDIEHFTTYSSPSNRCLRLARELVAGDIITDDRLLELNFGDWELQQWDDIPSARLERWMENFVAEPCPNGESYEDLFERVMDFWKELQNTQDHNVVLITHGGVIRCLLSHVLNIPLESSFRLEIGLGSVSAVSLNHGRPKVRYINR